LGATAVPLLEAIADRPTKNSDPNLCVRGLRSARHVILGPTGERYLLLSDARAALTLRLQGSRASLVNTCILLRGIPNPDLAARDLGILGNLIFNPNHDPHNSRDLLFLRDALVALDGRCVGASYREIAIVIYGWQKVRAAWSSRSRWMKDRMCRALARGEHLRDGGYRKLLE
jgi:hypothetical protein